jgi:hypothetical protein
MTPIEGCLILSGLLVALEVVRVRAWLHRVDSRTTRLEGLTMEWMGHKPPKPVQTPGRLGGEQ